MTLTLWQISFSPNSIKPRLALNYKKLPFEIVDINPQDRSDLVEATGQELTPVLVDDGKVIYDSQAILRYLDGNFRETPRCFPADREGAREVESWEIWAKHDLSPAMGLMIEALFGEGDGAAGITTANEIMNRAAEKIESALDGKPWLCGENVSAADFTAAPFMHYALLPEPDENTHPLVAHFAKNLKLTVPHERTADWVKRTMAYDVVS